MRLRVAAHQHQERIGHLAEEGLGQAAGRDDAERIAVEARVGRIDPALLAGGAPAERVLG